MCPHLDPGIAAERAYAAEQAKIARDRETNERRIREKFQRVGVDPGAETTGIWLDETRDKMSPEELYPDHFPEQTNDEEEQP